MSKANNNNNEEILNIRRAYTTGGKLGARQIFVFNEDGTIAGLQTVKPTEQRDNKAGKKKSKKSVGSEKKFGHISDKMSVSALSMAESKVAFSDANYMPEEG